MLIDAEQELRQIFGKDEDIADEGAMYSALAAVVLIAAYAFGLFRLLLGAPRLLEEIEGSFGLVRVVLEKELPANAAA